MIFLFYATESGNALHFAKRLGAYLTFNSRFKVFLNSVENFHDLEHFDQLFSKTLSRQFRSENEGDELLEQDVLLLIVASTYNIGEPPTAAQGFHKFLDQQLLILDKEMSFAKVLKKKFKVNLTFGVLALGDSCYADHCAFGIYVDLALGTLLGVECSLIKMGKLDDDKTADEVDQDFIKWRCLLLENIQQRGLELAKGTIADSYVDNTSYLDDIAEFQDDCFTAEVTEISFFNEAKECIRVVVHIPVQQATDESYIYKAADTLCLYARNDQAAVTRVIDHLNLNPNETVIGEWTVYKILEQYIDLNAFPDIDLLEQLTIFSPNAKYSFVPHENGYPKSVFQALIAMKTQDLNNETLFELNGCKFQQTNVFLNILPKMSFREYTTTNTPLDVSIFPEASEGPRWLKLEICVKNVLDVADDGLPSTDRTGHALPGLMSSFLLRNMASLVVNKLSVKAKLRTSAFEKIDFLTTTRFILICNGTGVAMVKAVVDHIKHLSNDGTKKRVLIFAGFRTEDTIPYKDVMLPTETDGLEIEAILALSRPLFGRKFHVQNKVSSEKAKIKAFLGEGKGIIALCGGSNMIRAVTIMMKRVLGAEELKLMQDNQSYIVEPFT